MNKSIPLVALCSLLAFAPAAFARDKGGPHAAGDRMARQIMKKIGVSKDVLKQIDDLHKKLRETEMDAFKQIGEKSMAAMDAFTVDPIDEAKVNSTGTEVSQIHTNAMKARYDFYIATMKLLTL